MKEREPERNESTDETVWLDLVARLQNMPADETHGGRDLPTAPRADSAGGPHEEPDAQGARAATGAPTSPADGTGVGGSAEPGHGTGAQPGGEAGRHGATDAGATNAGGSIHRSAAERTRAIFENQPFRAVPPRGPRDYDEPEELESEGEFVPPEPPPLGTGEPLVILAWLGAVGGPALLLLIAMFWRSAPMAVILGIIVLFVAAAGYLLFRLPQHHDDDGAAV